MGRTDTIKCSAISTRELELFWPELSATLERWGVVSIAPLGTTFKRDPMGDVDVACELSHLSIDDLTRKAISSFGQERVAHVGSSIISITWPHEDRGAVQVDLFCGSVRFLTWSRRGTQEGESLGKGALRNVALNVFLRETSSKFFSGLDRERLTLDFDKGLMRTVQTKRPVIDGHEPLKRWRVTSRTLVSSDPDTIVRSIFDDESLSAADVSTIEDVICLVKQKSLFSREILKELHKELETFAKTVPRLFYDDAEDIVSKVRILIE